MHQDVYCAAATCVGIAEAQSDSAAGRAERRHGQRRGDARLSRVTVTKLRPDLVCRLLCSGTPLGDCERCHRGYAPRGESTKPSQGVRRSGPASISRWL